MRRTAKGEIIDFDLIKAKQQMASKPAPAAVSTRQEIIDRRLRKKTTAMNPTALNTTPAPKPLPVPKPAPAPHVEPPIPEVPEPVAEEIHVDEEESTVDDSAKPRRRQKTKPRQSSGDEDVTDKTTT